MPGRGPARTPTAVLALHSSWRAKHRSKTEPEPKLGIPTRPGHLTREARAEWGRVAKELSRMGVLAKIDRAVLAAYCQAWANYVEVFEEVETEGRTFTMETTGYVAKNPKVTILNEERLAMLRLAQELGLTPASRSRLVGDKPEGQDELAAFVERRSG